MSHLKVKAAPTGSLISEVTPQSAGWSYVGFALHRLTSADGTLTRRDSMKPERSSGLKRTRLPTFT